MQRGKRAMPHGINTISLPAARVQDFYEKMVRFYLSKDATASLTVSPISWLHFQSNNLVSNELGIRVAFRFRSSS
jgi:hypothetical protein